MKNKKGITLVELIISVALISIVVLFLFQLFLDVRYSDRKVDYARNNQQERAIILKTIQDDFLDYGLIGLSDTSSTSTTLILDFTFNQEKQGKLVATANSISYTKANGETEKWILEDENMYYNVRCVSYTKNNLDEGDFYSILFQIPLVVSKKSGNAIDDLEFFYIGQKTDLLVDHFVDKTTLGSYDINSCSK